jgi:hypothetical protein
MSPEPVPADPGPGAGPGGGAGEPEGPWWEDGWEEDPPPHPDDVARLLAGCRDAEDDRAYAAAAAARAGTAAALAAAGAALAGRRGPGQPGSAEIITGEYPGRAAQFAAGMFLDTMPGGPELAAFADAAAGPDDCFDGITDDELTGIVCAWDRVEAHAAARKYAAVAELARRRPARGFAPEGPAGMPAVWDEFAPAELAAALAVSRREADGMLGLAHDLEVKLPGTRAAFRDGIVGQAKAEIIAAAVAVLDDSEARAAEALVLGRAGRLTPGGLRSAIARAVIEVAPEKAEKRREKAARQARVERWAEASGNAGLAGRELPAAQVLAADQVLTARARLLKQAGLAGSMDELRARALMDLLLGTDSRPLPANAGGATMPPLPAGFAGRVNLITPLASLLDLAGRPGEIPGIGPVDPALARDLAAAAARNPKTTWCVTVTDTHGHAIAHGCARPRPASRAKPGQPPPRAGPGFAFTPAAGPGPPGEYGTWRLRTPGGGPDLTVTLDPIATGPCDHRFQANGHDPGVKLRHLAEIRHATCTAPACRRPAATCDFEHNVPYEAGGKTCLCNAGPKCRFDHRLKQDPRWKADQRPDGTFTWTTPAGRTYTTEPTRYPI